VTSPNVDPPRGGRSADEIAGLRSVNPPSMANPDMWDNAENARGYFFHDILSGFLSLGQGIGELLDDLADALFGDYKGENASLGAIQDGQLELRNALENMRNVSGYAAAYMPTNPFEDRSTWKTAPFTESMLRDHSTGEAIAKNATVNGDGSITLAEGTWLVNAKCSWDQHDGGRTSMAIQVLNPDGIEYSRSEYFGAVHRGQFTTGAFSHTVVCPGPGYKVRVRYYNQVPGVFLYNKLRWLGGTHRSQLSASRWDLDADDVVVDEDDIKDEGEEEGEDGQKNEVPLSNDGD